MNNHLNPLTPQARKILRALTSGRHPYGLSRRDALIDYGIQNLTARISELRGHGVTMVKVYGMFWSSDSPREKQRITFWRLAN